MTGRKTSQKRGAGRRARPENHRSQKPRSQEQGADATEGSARPHAKRPAKTPDREQPDRQQTGQRTGQRTGQQTGQSQKQRGLWLYGLHAVSAALQNPKRHSLRLLATTGSAESLPDGRVEPEIVSRDVIDDAVPPGAVHQGVALQVGALEQQGVEDIVRHADNNDRTVVIALDQVTDPQNVGAALRSAAAFGACAVVTPDRNTPEASGAMAKAASGALETVPLIRPNNLVRALEYLKDHGFWVIGFDMDAPVSLPDADLPERCVLALGAEGRGLRRLTRETCDLMVRVPMTGAIESLNVSATAAVALYEWGRSAAR